MSEDTDADQHRPGRSTLHDLVEAARSRIEEIDVATLMREREAGEVTVIDIRDVRERWEKGAIPGAKAMPDGMLPFWVAPDSPYYRGGFDFDARYVVHCAGGMRSALAADRMRELGYTRVASLEPGFTGWVEAGGEVEEDRPDPKYFRG